MEQYQHQGRQADSLQGSQTLEYLGSDTLLNVLAGDGAEKADILGCCPLQAQFSFPALPMAFVEPGSRNSGVSVTMSLME